jgi:hypothetical protein
VKAAHQPQSAITLSLSLPSYDTISTRKISEGIDQVARDRQEGAMKTPVFAAISGNQQLSRTKLKNLGRRS